MRTTSGRCHHCNTRYIWQGKPLLRDAFCPNCGRKLLATTHLFKRGSTVVVTGDSLVIPGIA